MDWINTGQQDPILDQYRVYNIPKLHLHTEDDNRVVHDPFNYGEFRRFLISDDIADEKSLLVERLRRRGYVKTEEDIAITLIIKEAHEYLLGLRAKPPIYASQIATPIPTNLEFEAVPKYGTFIACTKRRYQYRMVYDPEVIDYILSTRFTINVNHYYELLMEPVGDIDSYDPYFKAALRWLKDPVGPMPRELVDDDQVIINMIGSMNPVRLISLDIKLGKRIALRKGYCIVIHPLFNLLGMVAEDDHTILDTGSSEKVITDYFSDGLVTKPRYEVYPLTSIEPTNNWRNKDNVLTDEESELLWMGQIAKTLRSRNFWAFKRISRFGFVDTYYDINELPQ